MTDSYDDLWEGVSAFAKHKATRRMRKILKNAVPDLPRTQQQIEEDLRKEKLIEQWANEGRVFTI